MSGNASGKDAANPDLAAIRSRTAAIEHELDQQRRLEAKLTKPLHHALVIAVLCLLALIVSTLLWLPEDSWISDTTFLISGLVEFVAMIVAGVHALVVDVRRRGRMHARVKRTRADG